MYVSESVHYLHTVHTVGIQAGLVRIRHKGSKSWRATRTKNKTRGLLRLAIFVPLGRAGGAVSGPLTEGPVAVLALPGTELRGNLRHFPHIPELDATTPHKNKNT